jgi:hypothetical protein
LMLGDRVVARTSPIMIAMRDGSRITLASNSQLRLESTPAGLTADLVSGSMQFTLAPASNLRVVRAGAPVEGRAGLVSPKPGTATELGKLPPPPPASPASAR